MTADNSLFNELSKVLQFTVKKHRVPINSSVELITPVFIYLPRLVATVTSKSDLTWIFSFRLSSFHRKREVLL
jgi:hypothetical protein